MTRRVFPLLLLLGALALPGLAHGAAPGGASGCVRGMSTMDLSDGVRCPTRGDYWASVGLATAAGAVAWAPTMLGPRSIFGASAGTVGFSFAAGSAAVVVTPAIVYAARTDSNFGAPLGGALLGFGAHGLAGFGATMVIGAATGDPLGAVVIGLTATVLTAPLSTSLGAGWRARTRIRRKGVGDLSLAPMLDREQAGLALTGRW